MAVLDYITRVDPAASLASGEYLDIFYADLSAAVTAIGATPGTLKVATPLFPNGAPCTVPTTLKIEWVGDGSLLMDTGETVTIKSDGSQWPIKKLFFNALAGQGTVSLAGNFATPKARGEWWGMVGDAAGTGSLVAPGTISGTDNKAQLQAALWAAQGGPGIVTVGSGRYLFTTAGKIIIPQNVRLEGTLEAPTSMSPQIPADVALTQIVGGTIFWITADSTVTPTEFSSANLTAPCFIQLGEVSSAGSVLGNASLEGVAFYYPNQLMSATTPVVYPFTIAMRGPNSSVKNVQLVNSYCGIDCSYTDRPTIHNVHGEVLFRGLYAARIRDTARFTNIHFNPYWSFFSNLYHWIANNGQAYVFGKCDWIQAENLFAYGYLIGFWMLGQGADTGFSGQSYPAGGPAGDYTNCHIDNTLWPFFSTGVIHSPDNRFHGCIFYSFLDDGSGTDRTGDGDATKGTVQPICLKFRPALDAVFQFSDCILSGNPVHSLEVNEPLSLTLQMDNINFGIWDSPATNQPALKLIGGGSTTISVVKVNNSNFRSDKPQVDITGYISFTWNDNTIAGTKRITSTANYRYVDGGGNNCWQNPSYVTFADADATPSVSGGYIFVEVNTGATTITNFDDMQDGQEITLLFTTANTTIQDNANVQLAGGANFVGTANDVLILKKIGTTTYEISRSVN